MTAYTDTNNTTGTITSSATYQYDDIYRKLTEQVNYGPLNGGSDFILSHSYEYYKNGTIKTFTGPDNNTYNYTYDNNNQLKTILLATLPNDPGGLITIDTYNWFAPPSMSMGAWGRSMGTVAENMKVY